MMTEVLHASEIVEIALRIEKNGEIFYGLLADKMTDSSVKELFLDLANEERKHFEIFKSLYSHASHWEPLETFLVEYRDYIDSLVSHNVFTRVNTAREVTERITTPKEALLYAQGIEKDSILLFIEMKACVPARESEIIEELIQEEKRHLTRLIKMEHDLD
jgi:rubrerythrin